MVKSNEKIFLIALSIIIILLNLFVGSSHREPKIILETFIIAVGLIYIITKKIQKEKNIIIKGKIDIFMLLMLIAVCMPILNRNCYSLNDTIDAFIEFLCAYVIYILARNIIKTKKETNIIIDIALISSIMIVIFGLDKLYYNKFDNFLKSINSIQSGAYAMISTFGYSNPVAMYMTFLSFLALGRYLCIQNKWIKNIYSVYIQIAMIGFVFGNSRALMVMYPVIFILYLIALKEKTQKLQSIFIIIINLIVAYIFQAVCNSVITSNLMLWIAFAIDLMIIYIISLLINPIIERVGKKINKKRILIIALITIISGVVYFIAVKDIGEPIIITQEKESIEVLGVKNNYSYNIKLDVSAKIQAEATSDKPNDKNLIILDYNSKRETTKIGEAKIQDGKQIIEFNIKTREDCDRIRIDIYNYQYPENEIVINHIYLNDKEYIADYKYLPNDIIRMIRTLDFKTVSVYERIEFYKDSLKLAQEHFIFGAGGKTFKNHIAPYQTYKHGYNAEAHSYIIDLLLNYGIVGLTIYIIIMIITVYNGYKIIKNYKEDNLPLYMSLLFGIILFTIHATIDFDLNYLLTISIYYMFIGIMNKQEPTQKIKATKINNFLDYAIIITLIAAITITVNRCMANYFFEKQEYEKAYKLSSYPESIKYKMIQKSYKDRDAKAMEKYLLEYIQDEKYKRNFDICQQFHYLIQLNMFDEEYDVAIRNLETLYKYATENDNISKIDTQKVKIKNSIIKNVLLTIDNNKESLENKEIQEWYNKFKEIVEMK